MPNPQPIVRIDEQQSPSATESPPEIEQAHELKVTITEPSFRRIINDPSIDLIKLRLD